MQGDTHEVANHVDVFMSSVYPPGTQRMNPIGIAFACAIVYLICSHGGRIGDIAIYGQESNPTTWRLAKMNLAIRRIEANLGPHHADTFHNDLHKDLKADFILANPPFNMSDWGGEHLHKDVRWRYGIPPIGNANFA